MASVTDRFDETLKTIGFRIGKDVPWMPNSYEYEVIYKITLKYDK